MNASKVWVGYIYLGNVSGIDREKGLFVINQAA